MKTVNISDELYEKLKGFVVDPFDDTPETVINRLVDITEKAKARWSPLDNCQTQEKQDNFKEQDQQVEESLVAL